MLSSSTSSWQHRHVGATRRARRGNARSQGVNKESHRAPLVPVDWGRFHLQVLFVDRTDTLRARLAAGMFERVAEWSGFGRALYAWTCGVDVDEAGPPGLSRRASLMSRAASLGMPAKTFARTSEQFDVTDLDRYDVVVAVSAGVKDSMLQTVEPAWMDHYAEQVRLLSEFGAWAEDADLLRAGGTALLPRRMSAALAPALEGLRAAGPLAGVAPLQLATASPEQWNATVLSLMLGSAGLAKYLMDAHPSDDEFDRKAQWLW